MSEKLKRILFAALAFVQLSGFAVIIYNHFSIERNGERALLRIDFSDPYNPLLGRYLRLRHDLNQPHKHLNTTTRLDEGVRGYLMLEKGADGYIQPMGLVASRPETGLYLGVFVQGGECSGGEYDIWSCEYYISPILDRYYAQDDVAIAGVKMFREITGEERKHIKAEKARRKAAAKAAEEAAKDPVVATGQQEPAGEERGRPGAAAEATGQEAEEGPIEPLHKIWVELRIAKGRVVMTQLYIDGLTIEQAVDKYRKDKLEDWDVDQLLRQAQ